jgi:hypothetical protein
MSFQHRDGSGSLFRNDKQGVEKRPDWRGDIILGGVLYEVSGWDKPTRNGDSFISMSGKVKTIGSKVPTGGKNDPRPATQQGPIENEDFNDKIPW